MKFLKKKLYHTEFHNSMQEIREATGTKREHDKSVLFSQGKSSGNLSVLKPG